MEIAKPKHGFRPHGGPPLRVGPWKSLFKILGAERGWLNTYRSKAKGVSGWPSPGWRSWALQREVTLEDLDGGIAKT